MAKANLIGAITGIFLYGLYILMFIMRLLGWAELGHSIAALQFLALVPVVYLLAISPQLKAGPLFILQLALMIAFLVLEFIVDYMLRLNFRETRWMVIAYVTFFFAATGGLLGIIASMPERVWIIVGGTLFLVMAVLAFVSRAVTGI